MSFTPITVTGSYTAPNGGAVMFQLVQPIMQLGGLVVPAVLNTAQLNVGDDYDISITLFATDDPLTIPQNIPYRVTEQINGIAENVYYITLPYNAEGGTININECPRVQPVSIDNTAISTGLVGAPGGLATLDEDGNIYAGQLGNLGVGSGDVTSVSNTDGTLIFNPTTGAVVGGVANPFPGPWTIDVNNITGGLSIQFQEGVTNNVNGFGVFGPSDAPIFTIPAGGAALMNSAQIGASYGVNGPSITFDGSTSPPSLLYPSGARQWEGAGTPTSVITAGEANVGDEFWDSASSVGYVCTVSGTPGTWVEGGSGSGVTAGAVEGLFTAAGQVFLGTGSGTGELISILGANETMFTAAGQLLQGTGSGAGALLNPGTNGYVLTSNGSGSAVSWQLLAGGGNMTTTTYDPAGISQQVVGTTASQTISGKRLVQRPLQASAPGATISLVTNNYDVFIYTAMAAACTISTAGSQSPNPGDSFLLLLTDNGTARALTFNSADFVATSVVLPTTTVAGVRMRLEFLWNEVIAKWECVGNP